jgi:DNA-binding MarR family transcriptional regulator
MNQGPIDPREQVLLTALREVLNVVPRAVEEDLRIAADLSTTEYQALVALADTHPIGLRLSELATRTGLSNSRASRLAHSLIWQGQARRRPVFEDGRGLRLVATARGLERLHHATACHVESVRRHVLDRLRVGGFDLDTLTRVLRELCP